MTASIKRKIWVARHAESEHQTGSSEWLDPGLSPKGLQQAPRLGNCFRDIPLDEIRVSPLKRARETLRLSGLTAPVMEYDSRLLEIAEPEHYAALTPYAPPDRIAAPDRAEAWGMNVFERARAMLNFLQTSNAENMLLVAHWGILSFIVRAFLDSSQNDILPFAGTDTSIAKLDNVCVGLMVFDDPAQPRRNLCMWNDRHHVEDLLQPL